MYDLNQYISQSKTFNLHKRSNNKAKTIIDAIGIYIAINLSSVGNGKDEDDSRTEWEKSRKRRGTEHVEETSRRKKRSISIERNVETLLVVDPAMVEYYQDEDLKTYVLTIMNMVSR